MDSTNPTIANLYIGVYLGTAILLKTLFITSVIILIRAILPRYRQDQMIKISWIVLIPYLGAAILLKTLLVTSIIILIRAILPRYRQDQMIKISWIVLIPLLLIYILSFI